MVRLMTTDTEFSGLWLLACALHQQAGDGVGLFYIDAEFFETAHGRIPVQIAFIRPDGTVAFEAIVDYRKTAQELLDMRWPILRGERETKIASGVIHQFYGLRHDCPMMSIETIAEELERLGITSAIRRALHSVLRLQTHQDDTGTSGQGARRSSTEPVLVELHSVQQVRAEEVLVLRLACNVPIVAPGLRATFSASRCKH